MTIRVVSDSTSDIPQDVMKELDIAVVPLNVNFGEQVYRDGVDITPDEFFKRLVSSSRPPTTSQPSVGSFLEVYRGLLDKAEAIVSVHISSRLSGTYNSALLARGEMSAACPIEVVDTMQVSLSAGLVAMAAARRAKSGGNMREVLEEVEKAKREVALFFTLDTLEYLAKGGRIGKAQAFLGSLLQIKPLLILKEGVVYPLERVRTRSRAIEGLERLVKGSLPLKEIFIAYSTDREEAGVMAKKLSPCLPEGEVQIGRLGPVIGTYAGPGALGVAVRRAL